MVELVECKSRHCEPGAKKSYSNPPPGICLSSLYVCNVLIVAGDPNVTDNLHYPGSIGFVFFKFCDRFCGAFREVLFSGSKLISKLLNKFTELRVPLRLMLIECCI